jgi:hypothetical protein
VDKESCEIGELISLKMDSEMTDDAKKILERYQSLFGEFLKLGASEVDARSLASAMAVSESSANTGLSSYQSLKNHADARAYGYRGIILKIEKLDFESRTTGAPDIKIDITTKIGTATGRAQFKGEQAYRVLSFLVGKYKEFETDLTKGFDRYQLANIVDYMEMRLEQAGLKIRRPDQDPYEIVRAIRGKFHDKLQLSNLLIGPDLLPGHRLDLPPNNIQFEARPEKVFESMF